MVLFIILPILAYTAYDVPKEYAQHTERALTRRTAVAQLSALTLEEGFRSLIQLGLTAANRPNVRVSIAEGNWAEAAERLRYLEDLSPEIDRIFLADTNGTEHAAVPELTGGVGRNFAHRDWYKGVTDKWQPYVSEIYQRAAEPQINVFAVAVPVKDTNGMPQGILVFQVAARNIAQWTGQLKDISGQPDMSISIADQYGRTVVDASELGGSRIVQLTDHPGIAKAHAGQHGVETFFVENEDRVVAFAPVTLAGWAVILEQPAAIAFAGRTDQMQSFLVFSLVGVGVSLLFAALITRLFERMLESRQYEESLLASIGDGLVAIDLEWRITRWNEVMARISGFKAMDAIGKRFNEVVTLLNGPTREDATDFIHEAMAKKSTTKMAEKTVLVHRDGTEVPVADTASPIIAADGSVLGAILIIRDETEEQNSRMLRSDFAYASHQLRTPVTKALWTLESALELEKKSELKGAVQASHQALQSLAQVVDDLVGISELDQSMVAVRPRTFSIRAVVDQILNKQGRLARERGVRLVSEIKATEGVISDEKLVTDTLTEVIHNAIIYSDPALKTPVTIAAEETADGLLINVHNDGPAIPEKEQPLVFTKFYRGSNHHEEIPGSGLGLTIALGYMRLVGGKIWFRSNKQEGTTFYVLIPRSVSEAAAPAPKRPTKRSS